MRTLAIVLGAVALAGCVTGQEAVRTELFQTLAEVAQQEIATVLATLGDRAGDPVWAVKTYSRSGEFRGWAVTERARFFRGSRLCVATSYFLPESVSGEPDLHRRDIYKALIPPTRNVNHGDSCSALDPVLEPFTVGEGVDPVAAIDLFLAAQTAARRATWARNHILCDIRVCISPRRALLSLSAARIQSVSRSENPASPGLTFSFYRDAQPEGFTFDPRSRINADLPQTSDGVITISYLTPVGG